LFEKGSKKKRNRIRTKKAPHDFPLLSDEKFLSIKSIFSTWNTKTNKDQEKENRRMREDD
jgi:hypothetical protein